MPKSNTIVQYNVDDITNDIGYRIRVIYTYAWMSFQRVFRKANCERRVKTVHEHKWQNATTVFTLNYHGPLTFRWVTKVHFTALLRRFITISV